MESEYKEFTGKSLESVISEAGRYFGVDANEIEYEIVDMGKSGILGFNAKPTVINAKVKEGVERKADIQAEEKAEEKKTEEKKAEKKEDAVKEEPVKEKAVKEEAKELQAENLPEAKERSVSSEEMDKAKAKVLKFLDDLFKAMELSVKSDISYNEADNVLSIDLSGPEMGILIGKRGQTLDSVQYLASLVVNRETEGYVRVKVDTEDYRERRRKTLENLAKNLAFKVKRTKRPVSLEPMNPYERRIIHSALQGDRYVVTHSEGDEPFRRVVITLKR